MINKNGKYQRQNIRLKGFDYSSQGIYFITICTHEKERIFGEIQNGVMVLNDMGKIAQQQWEELANRFPHIKLDIFQIMPNHMHGIIWVREGLPLPE